MAIVHDFEYVRPATLADAVAALAAAGPGARVLAGGTDVVPWLRDDAIAPGLLVDIKAVPGLDGIHLADGALTLGALVTFSDLIASGTVAAAAPMLAEMAHWVASVGVRNRATVVGNLCSAVPSLDAGPALGVYDATVHLAGGDGTRTVPLHAWFVGPRETLRADGEIVTAVEAHLPPDGHGAVFVKLSRYAGEDLAQANLAVLVTPDLDYRVAVGAVAPRPLRVTAVEDLLRGRALDDALVTKAKGLLGEAIAPISDVRASAAYRAHMCGVMLERGLHAASARCSGGGPAYPAHLI
jgi:CO/xanthine dehydrogenase FAD-binding subunit